MDVGINNTVPSLELLFLSSCELKAFTHFLRNLEMLEFLDLSNNKIDGQIPKRFSGMSLTFLDLSHNNFSDSVPNCLGNMVKLSVLDLRRNSFTGSLPPLYVQSTSLRTIVLNAWQGNLEELQVLILKSNKFHGPISTRQKFCFPKLRIFDLSHNEFSGSQPAEVLRNFNVMTKKAHTKSTRSNLPLCLVVDRLLSFYLSFPGEVRHVARRCPRPRRDYPPPRTPVSSGGGGRTYQRGSAQSSRDTSHGSRGGSQPAKGGT
ncbi:receptor-like protein 34 [Lycium barbarum]|uniref:receptor-like protein 34 n=1 Tax=Lycium barbarum TaxID=112863 RepID=UPI00293F550D|nr:receptor-like protein 34 [Lycium barbarum]